MYAYTLHSELPNKRKTRCDGEKETSAFNCTCVTYAIIYALSRQLKHIVLVAWYLYPEYTSLTQSDCRVATLCAYC